MFPLFLIELVVIFFFMSGGFLLALAIRRNDIADILWGMLFVIVVITALIFVGDINERSLLASSMVFIWGGRLTFRILRRNLKKKSEDFRYRQWRQEWGKSFYLRSFLQIFMLQGFLANVVVIPVSFIIVSDSVPLNLLDLIGISVWLLGFFFEAVGDYQLDIFKQNPAAKGQIMKTGLWKYSRHPNYFGEITMWWGIFLMALSVNNGFLSVIGPLTITFLVLKVSGIPMLEKKYIDNEAFQQYARRTSAIFPLPPKKEDK